MKVEIGAEAALFPEKEYISGILVAVQRVSERSTDNAVLVLPILRVCRHNFLDYGLYTEYNVFPLSHSNTFTCQPQHTLLPFQRPSAD